MDRFFGSNQKGTFSEDPVFAILDTRRVKPGYEKERGAGFRPADGSRPFMQQVVGLPALKGGTPR